MNIEQEVRAKDDDSPDVIEDGEAQEASVALVEDWRNAAAHNVR